MIFSATFSGNPARRATGTAILAANIAAFIAPNPDYFFATRSGAKPLRDFYSIFYWRRILTDWLFSI
ncbi:hypothetical protein [Paraburkholderia sacchari]|uniref:hypothetical protein n=1 Tax=Paraburkholderia sacchari TaxID=159450 RepID=UPI001BCC7279|nr:hypothetical protein [Paraburkholderia sacchari]